MTVRNERLAVSSQKTGENSMFRRIVICLPLTLLLLTVADAQQPKKVPRIGYLSVRDPAGEATRSEAIRLALRELGYIEGQNIAIEYRYSEGKRERYPDLARVAVFYDPVAPSTVLEVKEDLPVAARALKLTIQPWEVRTADGYEKVFAAMDKQRPDGLYAHPSGSLTFANGKRIADLALKSRLPSMYGRREAVEAGGFMSYGADVAESYRRVAYFVDRILKGAKPGDLPVEQPTKFELV